jgi:hypothetical protein
MKTLTNRCMAPVFAAMSLALFPMAAHAGGSGTVGGGERIGKYLRDLVDQGTCRIQTGRAFAEEKTPNLANILKRLEKTHWFFAEQLRAEISRMRICMVRGKLQRIRTNDAGDFVYYAERAQMVAIRSISDYYDSSKGQHVYRDYVFVEEGSFNALNRESKPYLLIHEAMHSLVSGGPDNRNQRIRNIVASIHDAVAKPMNAADFEEQLAYSAVETPMRASEADAFRDSIRVFVDPLSTEQARLAAYPGLTSPEAQAILSKYLVKISV